MRSHWMKSQKESLRLEEAGLTGDVLDSAISSFILEVKISSLICGWESLLQCIHILLGWIDLCYLPVNAEIRVLFTSQYPAN